MKKIFCIITCLFLINFTSCSNTQKYSIEDCVLTMTSIQSTVQNGDFIVFSPDNDTFDKNSYPSAVKIELTCTANNGDLSIIDATNNKSYTGNYKLTESTASTSIYEIVLDSNKGNAVISKVIRKDDVNVIALIISIGEYTLNFRTK